MKTALLLLLGLFLVARTSMAERITLRNGQTLEGTLTGAYRAATVALKTANGEIQIPYALLPQEHQKRYSDADLAKAWREVDHTVASLKKEYAEKEVEIKERFAKVKEEMDQLRAENARLIKGATPAQAAVTNQPAPALPAAGATVTGLAYVTRGAGDSIVLRDLEVSICRPDVLKHWERTMKGKNSKLDFLMGQVSFLSELPKYVEATTRTDIKGRFQFSSPSAGEHVLVATFSNPASAAWWLIPIQVDLKKSIEVNLTNSQATVIKDVSQ